MARTGRVLVVDDEVSARTALAELLRDEGYDVEMAADAFKAIGKFEAFAPHVIVTDLQMPGMDGIELVKKIRAADDPAAIVVMTAFGAIQTAVEALHAGAADYLTKPLDFGELLVVLDRVFETELLRRETRELRARLGERTRMANIIGVGPAMHRVFETIEQAAPSRATVLVIGETGTGKELIANAIHHGSPRAKRPFLKVHCTAPADAPLESELFGHERGAFANAAARKDGAFVMADGGTLFLDEVTELSPALQIRLLRFLQEHVVERMGSTEPIRLDVRVIAATARNLAEEVAQGRFREDLYYRLKVIEIAVPPLRERASDLPELTKFFIHKYAKANDKDVSTIAPQAMELLSGYDWPGNVGELESAIERAVVLTQGTRIEVRALPPTARSSHAAGMPKVPGATMADVERYVILETMKATGGSTSKAAEILGISTRTVQYRMHQYNEAVRSDVAVVKKP